MKTKFKKSLLLTLSIAGLATVLTSCIDGANNSGTDTLTLAIPTGYDGDSSGTLGTSGITFNISGDNVTFICPINYPYMIVNSVGESTRIRIRTNSGESLDNASGALDVNSDGDSTATGGIGNASTSSSAYANNYSIGDYYFSKVTCVEDKNAWYVD